MGQRLKDTDGNHLIPRFKGDDQPLVALGMKHGRDNELREPAKSGRAFYVDQLVGHPVACGLGELDIGPDHLLGPIGAVGGGGGCVHRVRSPVCCLIKDTA